MDNSSMASIRMTHTGSAFLTKMGCNRVIFSSTFWCFSCILCTPMRFCIHLWVFDTQTHEKKKHSKALTYNLFISSNSNTFWLDWFKLTNIHITYAHIHQPPPTHPPSATPHTVFNLQGIFSSWLCSWMVGRPTPHQTCEQPPMCLGSLGTLQHSNSYNDKGLGEEGGFRRRGEGGVVLYLYLSTSSNACLCTHLSFV